MTEVTPQVGDWYSDNGGQAYEIVCVDHEEWFVEIQYYDGTVEELDLADWNEGFQKGEIVKVDPPESW
jgi:hypothetical protein